MATVALDRFSGGDPESWIFRAERFFQFLGFSEENWLSLAAIYLEGDALNWFDWLFRNKQFFDWRHFTEKLKLRFRTQSFTTLQKPTSVELGRFHGENPEAWIAQAERYFEFYGIGEAYKLSLISIYLDGEALQWYRWLFRKNQLDNWKHFAEKVKLRFRKQHGSPSSNVHFISPKVESHLVASKSEGIYSDAPVLDDSSHSVLTSNSQTNCVVFDVSESELDTKNKCQAHHMFDKGIAPHNTPSEIIKDVVALSSTNVYSNNGSEHFTVVLSSVLDSDWEAENSEEGKELDKTPQQNASTIVLYPSNCDVQSDLSSASMMFNLVSDTASDGENLEGHQVFHDLSPQSFLDLANLAISSELESDLDVMHPAVCQVFDVCTPQLPFVPSDIRPVLDIRQHNKIELADAKFISILPVSTDVYFDNCHMSDTSTCSCFHPRTCKSNSTLGFMPVRGYVHKWFDTGQGFKNDAGDTSLINDPLPISLVVYNLFEKVIRRSRCLVERLYECEHVGGVDMGGESSGTFENSCSTYKLLGELVENSFLHSIDGAEQLGSFRHEKALAIRSLAKVLIDTPAVAAISLTHSVVIVVWLEKYFMSGLIPLKECYSFCQGFRYQDGCPLGLNFALFPISIFHYCSNNYSLKVGCYGNGSLINGSLNIVEAGYWQNRSIHVLSGAPGAGSLTSCFLYGKELGLDHVPANLSKFLLCKVDSGHTYVGNYFQSHDSTFDDQGIYFKSMAFTSYTENMTLEVHPELVTFNFVIKVWDPGLLFATMKVVHIFSLDFVSCFFSCANVTTYDINTSAPVECNVPAWNISILPNCEIAILNTFQVHAQAFLGLLQSHEGETVTSLLHWSWRLEELNKTIPLGRGHISVIHLFEANVDKGLSREVNNIGYILHVPVSSQYLGPKWDSSGIFNCNFENEIKFYVRNHHSTLITGIIKLQSYAACCDLNKNIVPGLEDIVGWRNDEKIFEDFLAHKLSYWISLLELFNQLFASNSYWWDYSFTERAFGVELGIISQAYLLPKDVSFFITCAGTFVLIGQHALLRISLCLNLEDKVLIEGGSNVMNAVMGLKEQPGIKILIDGVGLGINMRLSPSTTQPNMNFNWDPG